MKTTKFKIGDRVFSYSLQQWGTVEMRVATSSNTTITVYFDNLERKRIYEENGKLFPTDKASDLFYSKVSITPPLKPLPDLKIDDKVIVWNNYTPEEKYNRYFAGWEGGRITCFCDGSTSWSAPKAGRIITWENWEIIEKR